MPQQSACEPLRWDNGPPPLPSCQCFGQHHEYRGPIGFAVEYATPGDDIISNYSSTFLLPVVLGVHPVVWLLWIGFRLLQTYETHSGYGTCARFPHPRAFCKPGWRTDCERPRTILVHQVPVSMDPAPRADPLPWCVAACIASRQGRTMVEALARVLLIAVPGRLSPLQERRRVRREPGTLCDGGGVWAGLESGLGGLGTLWIMMCFF